MLTMSKGMESLKITQEMMSEIAKAKTWVTEFKSWSCNTDLFQVDRATFSLGEILNGLFQRQTVRVDINCPLHAHVYVKLQTNGL